MVTQATNKQDLLLATPNCKHCIFICKPDGTDHKHTKNFVQNTVHKSKTKKYYNEAKI
jgi:hypothetical protein